MSEIAKRLKEKEKASKVYGNYVSVTKDGLSLFSQKSGVLSVKNKSIDLYTMYKKVFNLNAVDIIDMSVSGISSKGKFYMPVPDNKNGQRFVNWAHKQRTQSNKNKLK